MVFSLSALWWRKIRGLWKLPDGRDWLRGKLGLVLMGRVMLSKSLPQFSVEGRGCVPSLLFDLRPNCGGGNAAFLSKTIFPEVFLFKQVDWLFIKELSKGLPKSSMESNINRQLVPQSVFESLALKFSSCYFCQFCYDPYLILTGSLLWKAHLKFSVVNKWLLYLPPSEILPNHCKMTFSLSEEVIKSVCLIDSLC